MPRFTLMLALVFAFILIRQLRRARRIATVLTSIVRRRLKTSTRTPAQAILTDSMPTTMGERAIRTRVRAEVRAAAGEEGVAANPANRSGLKPFAPGSFG
jgi:hypothetical protein